MAKRVSVFLHGATSAIVITAPDIYIEEGVLWVAYEDDEDEVLCYPLSSIKFFRLSCIKEGKPNDKT